MNNGYKPAYPVHGGDGDDPRNHIIQGGLTKREIFAMAAMQGICAKYNDDDKYHVNGGWLHAETVAKNAIEIADELLKQLES